MLLHHTPKLLVLPCDHVKSALSAARPKVCELNAEERGCETKIGSLLLQTQYNRHSQVYYVHHKQYSSQHVQK